MWKGLEIVSIGSEDPVPVLLLAGELDFATAGPVRARLRELGDRPVAIDLGGLTFTDSARFRPHVRDVSEGRKLMLAMTQSAVNAIKHIAPGESGVGCSRSNVIPRSTPSRPRLPSSRIPATQGAGGRGAHVFLKPKAADTLDDMVLDATHDERGVRFAVSRRPAPPAVPDEHDG